MMDDVRADAAKNSSTQEARAATAKNNHRRIFFLCQLTNLLPRFSLFKLKPSVNLKKIEGKKNNWYTIPAKTGDYL